MSKKHNPTTVLVRLVIDEIREGRNGEALAVCVACDGKRHKIPYANIVALVEQHSARIVEIRAHAS